MQLAILQIKRLLHKHPFWTEACPKMLSPYLSFYTSTIINYITCYFPFRILSSLYCNAILSPSCMIVFFFSFYHLKHYCITLIHDSPIPSLFQLQQITLIHPDQSLPYLTIPTSYIAIFPCKTNQSLVCCLLPDSFFHTNYLTTILISILWLSMLCAGS